MVATRNTVEALSNQRHYVKDHLDNTDVQLLSKKLGPQHRKASAHRHEYLRTIAAPLKGACYHQSI